MPQVGIEAHAGDVITVFCGVYAKTALVIRLRRHEAQSRASSLNGIEIKEPLYALPSLIVLEVDGAWGKK